MILEESVLLTRKLFQWALEKYSIEFGPCSIDKTLLVMFEGCKSGPVVYCEVSCYNKIKTIEDSDYAYWRPLRGRTLYPVIKNTPVKIVIVRFTHGVFYFRFTTTICVFATKFPTIRFYIVTDQWKLVNFLSHSLDTHSFIWINVTNCSSLLSVGTLRSSVTYFTNQLLCFL